VVARRRVEFFDRDARRHGVTVSPSVFAVKCHGVSAVLTKRISGLPVTFRGLWKVTQASQPASPIIGRCPDLRCRCDAQGQSAKFDPFRICSL
jgi:hypothetical protein